MTITLAAGFVIMNHDRGLWLKAVKAIKETEGFETAVLNDEDSKLEDLEKPRAMLVDVFNDPMSLRNRFPDIAEFIRIVCDSSIDEMLRDVSKPDDHSAFDPTVIAHLKELGITVVSKDESEFPNFPSLYLDMGSYYL